jgi:hypothetical protein
VSPAWAGACGWAHSILVCRTGGQSLFLALDAASSAYPASPRASLRALLCVCAPRDCALTSSIPPELPGAWTAIKEVALHGNKLTGNLPGNWAPSLEALDLQ